MARPRTRTTRLHLRADDLEPAYRRAAARLLGREREEIASLITKAADRGGAPFVKAALRAVDRAYTKKEGRYHVKWVESFTTLNTTAFEVAGRELIKTTGLNFRLLSPGVVEAVERRTDMLADFIGEASSLRVSDAVTEALTEGGGISDLASAIRDDAFDEDISLARAERIARTEAMGSLNEGQYEQATDSGVFVEKGWLHSGNPRNPRDWHAEMDGERVPIDQPFSNGLDYPGQQGAPPEEVINCGCTCEYYS